MLNIALCDDESIVVDELQALLQEYEKTARQLLSIHKFPSGESLLQTVNEGQYDVIFMDIKMEQLDGIETAKKVRTVDESVFLIFVSSLPDYVFDVFDVNARGFLVKPVDKEKLFSLLDKIISKIKNNTGKTLTVLFNGAVTKIPLTKIHYCEVRDHSLFIYEREKIHQYQGKIEDLERELSQNATSDFFRCHRSYIVSFRYVEKFCDGMIYLPSGEKIPVASRRKKEFTQKLLHFQRKDVR